jgi:archaellum biogenesis protein FlaJ (TadC family)
MLTRIESKKVEKRRRLFGILSILFLIIISSDVYLILGRTDFGIGAFFDFLIKLVGGLVSFWQYKKLKKRLGQFIEWDLNEVKFKLGESDKIIQIENATIKEISFYGDIIDIKTNNDNLYKLNSEDLGEFRPKIRENFERIKITQSNKRL